MPGIAPLLQDMVRGMEKVLEKDRVPQDQKEDSRTRTLGARIIFRKQDIPAQKEDFLVPKEDIKEAEFDQQPLSVATVSSNCAEVSWSSVPLVTGTPT